MDPFSGLPFDLQLEQLKKYCSGDITINGDGSIDVDGHMNLSQLYLAKIPFKFRHVSGYFDCSYNRLISLDGAPTTVGGSFLCTDNNMFTSLDGAPTTVGGNFWCTISLPYSELFKIVDRVKYDIYYSSDITPEDKDKIRRDRDVKTVLKDDELGNLDV